MKILSSFASPSSLLSILVVFVFSGSLASALALESKRVLGLHRLAVADTLQSDSTKDDEPHLTRDTVMPKQSLSAQEASTLSDSSTTNSPPAHIKPWKAQIKTQYSSLNERQGVDLSGSAPTADLGLKISHSSGAYLSFDGIERLGAQGLYQQSTFSAGYTYAASENIDLSADLSLYRYPNDSVNALAGSPASLSLSADIEGKGLDYSLSFDHYFGNPVANYLMVGISHDFSFGEDEDFSIIPAMSISYGSTKYKLKKLNTEKTLKGLNAVIFDVFFNYTLGGGFVLSADPTMLVSYQKDLLKVLKGNINATSKATQFLIVVGLRYSYAF